MPKARLDHTTCLLARCEAGKKKTDYYDETVTGFVLECRASGGKTFYLRYDQNGRQRQIKLAVFGSAPFAAVKKKAVQLRAEAELGSDPASEKAKARAVPIYAELAAQHMNDAKLHQRSYDTTEMYMRRHIVTRWGKVRLTDIGPQAIAHWLAEKRKHYSPATVVKMKAIFGRSFELGRQWGIAGCENNPVRGIKLPPVNNARSRYLTTDEAGRLRAAASKSKNTQLRNIIDLLLLTGARVGELLIARWEHVDVDRQSWLIPTSKTGRARHVPLSTAALTVIEGLPRWEGCPWLLPNPKTRQPFTDLKHPWQTARDAAGLPGLRIHDLRHSAASFMVNSGVDLFAVGRVLGHASVQSTQRYSHLANDTLLAAVEAGAAKQAA